MGRTGIRSVHLDEDLLKRLLLMVTGNIMIAVVDAVRMVQSSSAVLDEYLNYDMRQYVGKFFFQNRSL